MNRDSLIRERLVVTLCVLSSACSQVQAARQATLKISSNPQGASIYTNNRYTGRVTPATISVSPGSVTVRLKKDGYRDAVKGPFAARAGVTYTINLVLRVNPTNPFAGSWSGTWSVPSVGQDGTVTLTIAPHGRATGTIYDRTTDETGSFTGTISTTGNVSGTVVYPYQLPTTLQGTASIAGSGHMLGNFTQKAGDVIYAGTFDLTKG